MSHLKRELTPFSSSTHVLQSPLFLALTKVGGWLAGYLRLSGVFEDLVVWWKEENEM